MKKHTILIIDDQPENLEIVIDYLENSSDEYNILVALNGEIACKIATKEIPDLIITDWDMPVMNGIEVIKYLKSKKATKDIPIIMSTGVMISYENLETALSAGAVDYIAKPINRIELNARVNSMLKLSDSFKEINNLNATKDKFFSIIAHDLKNPFNLILGFTEELTRNFFNFSNTQQYSFISLINESAHNTFKLLENLLLWSASQQGSLKFNPIEENLSGLVGEIIIFSKLFTEKKDIVIENMVNDKLTVFVDKNMFHTILRNLLSNAIKFSHKGGKITINAIAIVDENNKSFVKISVIDNGVGISPEIKSKLFLISEKTSTKGTENETGSGLGLILCKEFVDKHGGKIWIESEKDKGSMFCFTIPESNDF